MTRAALEVLSKDPDGFFLMVEDGFTDKSAHALDWERAIYDMVALDQAMITRAFQEGESRHAHRFRRRPHPRPFDHRHRRRRPAGQLDAREGRHL